MIQAGSTYTFDVQGTTGQWVPRTVAGVRADVLDQLSAYFDVEDVSIETTGFLSDPVHYVTNWAYRSTIRASVRADYGDIRDVDSIIANAFYNATGDLPTVTAQGQEGNQSDASTTAPGSSLTSLAFLAVVGLLALAYLKFES